MKNTVSIVIPTYGRPDTLARAIKSALNQTYSNLEIIVVDDNDPSTTARTNTERVLSDFEDKRLIYIKHSENRNGAAARNTGIKNASGDYIAFLDDDDEFEKNKIQEQLEYISENSQFKAVYCKTVHFKNNNRYYKTQYNKEGKLQYDILTMQQELYTPALLVDIKILREINGFNENFDRHQDYDLLLRISENYKIGCVDKYLLKVHNDDTLNQPAFRQYEKIKKSFLNEFAPYIEKYHGREKDNIYRIHYFDLFYYALKHGKAKKSIGYFIRSKPNLTTLIAMGNKMKKVIRRVWMT